MEPSQGQKNGGTMLSLYFQSRPRFNSRNPLRHSPRISEMLQEEEGGNVCLFVGQECPTMTIACPKGAHWLARRGAHILPTDSYKTIFSCVLAMECCLRSANGVVLNGIFRRSGGRWRPIDLVEKCAVAGHNDECNSVPDRAHIDFRFTYVPQSNRGAHINSLPTLSHCPHRLPAKIGSLPIWDGGQDFQWATSLFSASNGLEWLCTKII